MILNDLWMGGMSIRRYLNYKVIASILCFPLVLRIEFKSAEELKLQPKTHEEHLATQDESDPDDDDDDDNDSDSYNSGTVSNDYTHCRASDENLRKKSSKFKSDTSVELIIENPINDTESIEMVTLNKSITDHPQSELTNLKQTLSTPVQHTDDINDINIETSGKINNLKENLLKKTSTIPVTQRFYEFYNAPITKFWYNAIFYVVFLFLFTYLILIRTPPKPSIAGKRFFIRKLNILKLFLEYIITIYLASAALDAAREVC